MNAVAGLLGADIAGQCDFCEHRRSVVAVAGVHGDQAGERGTEMDPPGGEPLAHLVTGNPVGVRRQKLGNVLTRGGSVVVDSGQCRHGLADALAVLFGLHSELCQSGASDGRDGCDIGVLIEQHQLFELDVSDLAVIAEHEFCCGQGHLAVSGSGVRRYVIDTMVAQPRQSPSADVGLPGVPLGLFRQAYMLA